MKGKLTAMSYKIKVRNCHLLLYATIQLWLPQMETTQTKKKKQNEAANHSLQGTCVKSKRFQGHKTRLVTSCSNQSI